MKRLIDYVWNLLLLMAPLISFFLAQRGLDMHILSQMVAPFSTIGADERAAVGALLTIPVASAAFAHRNCRRSRNSESRDPWSFAGFFSVCGFFQFITVSFAIPA
jgi:hypothetical protein